MSHYILQGRETVAVNLKEYIEWVKRTGEPVSVAFTYIGQSFVSTVFLGVDHNLGHKPPQLFETLVFGGKHDGVCVRCATWTEAEAHHLSVVNSVKDTQCH